MRLCARCIMPDTRPRMTLDAEGVCNACRYAETKGQIDWEARQKDFVALLHEHGCGWDRPYDVVVPWSGGKDSSAIAFHLREDYGLNPLLANVHPLLPTEVGEWNRTQMRLAGFNTVSLQYDQRTMRLLAKRFLLDRGNPEVARAALINAWPMRVALMYDIPLVVYAEHGESEYGGHVLSPEELHTRSYSEVLEHQIGDHPANWQDGDISARDLAPYQYPEAVAEGCPGQEKVKAVYYGYYHRWDAIGENVDYVADRCDFKGADTGRSVGTFTEFDSLDDDIDPLYFHLAYLKFGLGRATRDACRLIQNDRMTRELALWHAALYDAEPPRPHQWARLLEYLDMSSDELSSCLYQHTHPDVRKITYEHS